ncbi:MAG: hypothetical protein IJ725_06595 [Ruminococcus sp.]|nr:hypothetical protein [Ruminococcus sp.]
MLKDFFKPMDNIKPSENDIERYIEAAVNKDKITEIKPKKARGKITAISVIAATLALIIALGIVFYPKAVNSKNNAKSDYSFTLVANAAEIKNKNLGSNVIGAFEGGSSYGAYLKGQEGYGKYPDWFQQFDLSSLRIEGENIKSVTVSSRNKGIYFNVNVYPKIIEGDINQYSPDKEGIFISKGNRSVCAENYKSEEEYNKARAEEKKKYTDTNSFNNSQYTHKQITGASYTGFFGDFVCDSMTYNNTDKKKVINLDSVIELTVESIQTDDNNVSEYLKRINEIEEKEELVNSDESFEKDKLLHKILKIIIDDTSLDITVEYNNGKKETKSFALGMYVEDEWFTWLTLSEN